MLRCNALTRVAAGAAQAASGKHVAHLTRSLNHLSLSSKLAPVSRLSNPIARSFATKVVKKKTTTKAKAKTPVKKKTPAKPAAKAKSPAVKKKAPVRKKIVKKKVVAKPKKKVPTEAQKAKAARAKVLGEITKLKKTALIGTTPKLAPETAWTLFVSEKAKGTRFEASGTMKAIAGEYKELTSSELEHYNHIANQNRAINEKAYKGWINSHTPEQIRVANLARTSLKRKVAAGAPGIRKGMKGLSKIKDERQPKRPASAYIIFATERRASGDFKNISLPETAKLITQEWKALGPAETKKYADLQEANKARYVREFQTAYGHPAPTASAAKVAA
ncbi:hypothetical protein EG328_005215 [Venturia inaequalis]|uniref:HMG box domain-containing protein n=1 Tax=Venturia inaequalis TaxID=5025 RepID=A0A8H3ZBT4_VENIN|nr:hypothetical protein EG328_005215 [Venturia inaequalis]KAE9994060.1 hypothetical protein EG327_001458 [Venturia inaequalis]RDI80966.1 hypothetical protein Vi05172_g9041 [Venturia inaequalis]